MEGAGDNHREPVSGDLRLEVGHVRDMVPIVQVSGVIVVVCAAIHRLPPRARRRA